SRDDLRPGAAAARRSDILRRLPVRLRLGRLSAAGGQRRDVEPPTMGAAVVGAACRSGGARVNDKLSSIINGLFSCEMWAEAQSLLERNLEANPGDHWLLARLATCRYEVKDYEGALALAERSLKIDPACPLAMWERANALQMLDLDLKAINAYLKLIGDGFAVIRRAAGGQGGDTGCWEGGEWDVLMTQDAVIRLAASYRGILVAEREACARLAEENEPLGGCGEVAEAIRRKGENT